MDNKLCDNLIALMQYHHISGMQLARATGIPLSTIKNIRKRTNKNPTIETLIPLARHFAVSLEELIDGEPLARKKWSTHHHETLATPRILPVISWKEAIHWPQNISNVPRVIYTEKNCSQHTFVLSMEEEDVGLFTAPGLFLIDPALSPKHLDYVLIHKTPMTHAFVKQFICDEEFTYLKSMTMTNQLVRCHKKYRLLGVIIEYRQRVRQSSDEKRGWRMDIVQSRSGQEMEVG